MERAGWNYPSGEFRVSDADRDRALAELGEAFRVGRLTAGEYDERSGQALASRTGRELAALLADLPPARLPVARPAARPDPVFRVFASRTVFAAAITAMCCSALAVGAAVNHGPSPQQQEFNREWAARHGLALPAWSPAPGFDWVGTLTPALIAVLLVVLIVFLRKRLAAEDRR